MTTPAGWYDDGSGNRRWWDGLQWTEHVVTAPQPAPTEQAFPSAEAAEPGAETATPGTPAGGARQESAPFAPDRESVPEPAPFAPPYTMASAAPAEPAYAPGPAGVAYPGAAGISGAPWAAPAAQPPASGVSVLGIIGLAVVVIGVVCACIPVIAIAGWGLLGIGFVLSLISLFLRGRKWPGITGMAVAAVGAILAISVSLIVLGATSTTEGESTPLAAPSERPPADDGSMSGDGEDPSDIEGAEMVTFDELEVGDCLPLVDYGDEGEIYELPVVPCEQPHTDEVYFIFDVEDGEFPGDDALTQAASEGCLAEFESFAGIPYDDSVLDFYSYQPTKTSWIRAGDRTVQCIMYSYEDVTGTLRGANY